MFLDRWEQKIALKRLQEAKVVTKEVIREVPAPSNEVAPIKKRAKAYDPSFSTWDLGKNRDLSPSTNARYNNISWRELEQIYLKSSVIRAIIDGITRIISSLDWRIVSNTPDTSNISVRTKNQIKRATEFFKNPNANDESFSTFRSKVVRDLLIYDTSVIEKVFNKNRELTEIWSRDPKHFHVKINQHGVVGGYEQRFVNKNRVVSFAPEEIIYLVMHPSSSTPYGNPVMDALVNEIAAAMLSTQLIAKISEYDQIPPGILNLGKIGEQAYERAREYFEEGGSGGKKDYELTIIHDTEKVEWTRLTKDPKELQLSELIDKIHRMIFRCFGITPLEMGSIEDTTRATAMVQESISNSKLLRPISLILKDYIDIEIIWSHFSPNISIEFDKPKEDDLSHILQLANLVPMGILTINELRYRLNEDAIPGGDEPYILHPNLPFGAVLVKDMADQLTYLNNNITGLEQGNNNVDNKSKKFFPKEEKEEPDNVEEVNNDDVDDEQNLNTKLKQELMEVFDESEKWLMPALVQSVIYEKEKTRNVIDRMGDQLYSKMNNVLKENNIKNKDLNSLLLIGIKSKIAKSISVFRNRNFKSRSTNYVSKNLRRIVSDRAIVPIHQDICGFVENILKEKTKGADS